MTRATRTQLLKYVIKAMPSIEMKLDPSLKMEKQICHQTRGT